MTKLSELYKLRSLTRYQNLPRVRDESVAEHTAMCALILLKLESIYKEDLTQAVRYSVIHDLPEIGVTDVPHNVKQSFPDIALAVDMAEEQMWQSSLLWASGNKTVCSPRQKLWAKLADALSVLQYAQSELSLGNVHFSAVLSETKVFVKQCLVRLQISEHLLSSFTDCEL